MYAKVKYQTSGYSQVAIDVVSDRGVSTVHAAEITRNNNYHRPTLRIIMNKLERKGVVFWISSWKGTTWKTFLNLWEITNPCKYDRRTMCLTVRVCSHKKVTQHTLAKSHTHRVDVRTSEFEIKHCECLLRVSFLGSVALARLYST